jgi:hypothetical protein
VPSVTAPFTTTFAVPLLMLPWLWAKTPIEPSPPATMVPSIVTATAPATLLPCPLLP